MYVVYQSGDKRKLKRVETLIPTTDKGYLEDENKAVYSVMSITSITRLKPKGFGRAKLGKNKRITTIITPFEINPTRPWSTKWGHMESEISAGLLVKFAQENGSWRNFTKKELDAWAGEDFWFNGLVNGKSGDIVLNDDNTYSFTNAFIEECYKRNAVKK